MKKKIVILAILFILNILLIGCQHRLTTTTNVTTESTTTTTQETTTTEPTEEFKSIADVINSPLGDLYKVRATVVGTTPTGVLIYDETGFIYINLGSNPSVSVNDYIEVYGRTISYNDTVEFNEDTIISVLGINEPYTFLARELRNQDVDNYLNNFRVGDFLRITGNINVNGKLVSLSIPSSNVMLTLLSNDIDFSNYNNIEVTVDGFALFVNGSSTKYLNILVTEVIPREVTPEYLPLTILSINDLHGYVERSINSNGHYSGISRMSYLVNKIRNENPLDDVVLIANGDMFQGTAISNLTYGESVIKAMNMMGFDMMGIGNHEFDWGLETILKYFDNDESNGEANFPLINSNIYYKNSKQLVTVENGKVFDSYIISREGINVGIMSYIGNLYSSIQKDKLENYYFDLDFRNSIKNIGNKLKKQGADIIILNIHDYDSYIYDDLAFIRDDNGDYLLDVIIAGHTHQGIKRTINRVGDSIPLIQAYSYGTAMGRIDLKIDTNTKDIVEYNVNIINTSEAGNNYDEDIEALIREYVEELELEKTLVYAGETVRNKDDMFEWIGNVLLKAVDADIAISNTGGVRGNGNIKINEPVTIKNVFEVYPFDNEIYIITAKYRDIKNLLKNNNIFYSTKEGVTFKDNEYYRIAVISYVYYWDSLDHLRNDTNIKTDLILLHLLIEDLEIKGTNGEIFKPISNPYASIDVKYH